MEKLIVAAKFVNQKVQFSAVSSTNPNRTILINYVPPIAGWDGFAGLNCCL